MHWRGATSSVLALSLGWNGRGAILELSPLTGLVGGIRARLPSDCAALERATALREGGGGRDTFFAALTCFSSSLGTVVYAFDLTTGKNTSFLQCPRALTPTPLLWLPGTGLLGGDSDGPLPRLMLLSAAGARPLATLPAGALRDGAITASPAGEVYVGVANGTDGGSVLVLDGRANFSTLRTLATGPLTFLTITAASQNGEAH